MSEEARKIAKKMREDYNQIAEGFSATRQKPWKEMEEFTRFVPKDGKVLDLGCGNGRLYQVFADKAMQYWGMDISERLLEEAENFYGRRENLHWKVGDMMEELPFEDKFFDAVFMVASFHHIPTAEARQQVLKEIKRVTKDGGWLVMTNWNLRAWHLMKKYKLWHLLWGGKVAGAGRGDTWIKWSYGGRMVTERYYHAFAGGELKKLFKKGGWHLEEQYYVRQGTKTSAWRGENIISILRKI